MQKKEGLLGRTNHEECYDNNSNGVLLMTGPQIIDLSGNRVTQILTEIQIFVKTMINNKK